MSDSISHIGTIDSISDGVLFVRIVQNSACVSCKIASRCSSAESKEKLIQVKCPDASRYYVGQEVNVMAAASVGYKAVIYAFVVPTILMFAVIVSCIYAEMGDLTAAVSGLGVLIPYYLLLFLLRKKLERTLSFWIEETNN